MGGADFLERLRQFNILFISREEAYLPNLYGVNTEQSRTRFKEDQHPRQPKSSACCMIWQGILRQSGLTVYHIRTP